MNKAEVAKLLTLAAGYDGRQAGETDVHAWHEIVAGYPYEQAAEAVVAHYRHQTRRIMPADVTGYCRNRGNELADHAADQERQAISAAHGHADADFVRELRKSMPAYTVQDDDGRTLYTGPAEHLRALVLSHADLAQRLTEPPLNYTRADQWTGYVPPLIYGDRRNDSRTRPVLVDLVRVALDRQRQQHGQAS